MCYLCLVFLVAVAKPSFVSIWIISILGLNELTNNLCLISLTQIKPSIIVIVYFFFSFSHGPENDSSTGKSLTVQNSTINETDRLQVTNVNSFPVTRRESFLYRSESDGENSQPPRSSRHSSISSSDWYVMH